MRRDIRLTEQAIRQRWPIKPEHRAAIINKLVRVALDPETSPRETISASKALVNAEGQNQTDEHFYANQPDQPSEDLAESDSDVQAAIERESRKLAGQVPADAAKENPPAETTPAK